MTSPTRIKETSMMDTANLFPQETTCHRCAWAGDDPLMIEYHDREWGVPVHDDRRLFEFLILEGAQAGLSWSTILRKRGAYRKLFDDFDPRKVAEYTDEKITELIGCSGIVRNRLKIESAITNARAFLTIQQTCGSFDRFIWSFVGGIPVQNGYVRESDIPAQTEISQHMAATLKKKGFRFVGPTICYAFMQATGMVNDHTISCFRHKALI